MEQPLFGFEIAVGLNVQPAFSAAQLDLSDYSIGAGRNTQHPRGFWKILSQTVFSKKMTWVVNQAPQVASSADKEVVISTDKPNSSGLDIFPLGRHFPDVISEGLSKNGVPPFLAVVPIALVWSYPSLIQTTKRDGEMVKIDATADAPAFRKS